MNNQTNVSSYNRIEILKLMYLSREGDRREGVLLRQGKGWWRIAGKGHETMAVVPLLMRRDDYLFPYYRDRAMMLARGVANADLALAYFGKHKSSSGGRQMPGHYSDRSRNIWSVPSPTGSHLLPACGVAWAMKLKKHSSIVVATVGDAATRQGEFYEAVSFAIERQLPLILIVEDNSYGISTNTSKYNPFNLGVFGGEINLVEVDARHPDRVFNALDPVVQRTRSGEGPTVMVFHLDRLCSHASSDDQTVYRSQREIERVLAQDPVEAFSLELIKSGELSESEWEGIKESIKAQVDADYIAAENELDPSSTELMDHTFSESVDPLPPPLVGGRRWRIVDAVNYIFHRAAAESSDYFFFGEDIEDPKGGVFGLTSGLSTSHPERVFNSPLAEATIAGIGVGMACYGLKPIFEFQFVDFISPAWNQISQNLSTLRWRSFGDWSAPCVFYAPYGAYSTGGGLWHSQANESLYAHLPGIYVIVPSTPEDAAGLLWTSMHCHDPVLFLIPKNLLRNRMEIPLNLEAVGIGEARVRKRGSDVTVVTWGNCVDLVIAASNKLSDEAELEIIDLRTIQPWDKRTVTESVKKTGRLVVVEEDGRSCSVGQMIISEMVDDPDSFYSFVSPPRLVSKPDVHIGYNPIYEYAALPGVEDVVESIRFTLEE